MHGAYIGSQEFCGGNLNREAEPAAAPEGRKIVATAEAVDSVKAEVKAL
jgi:hypothetical protein